MSARGKDRRPEKPRSESFCSRCILRINCTTLRFLRRIIPAEYKVLPLLNNCNTIPSDSPLSSGHNSLGKHCANFPLSYHCCPKLPLFLGTAPELLDGCLSTPFFTKEFGRPKFRRPCCPIAAPMSNCRHKSYNDLKLANWLAQPVPSGTRSALLPLLEKSLPTPCRTSCHASAALPYLHMLW